MRSIRSFLQFDIIFGTFPILAFFRQVQSEMLFKLLYSISPLPKLSLSVIHGIPVEYLKKRGWYQVDLMP